MASLPLPHRSRPTGVILIILILVVIGVLIGWLVARRQPPEQSTPGQPALAPGQPTQPVQAGQPVPAGQPVQQASAPSQPAPGQPDFEKLFTSERWFVVNAQSGILVLQSDSGLRILWRPTPMWGPSPVVYQKNDSEIFVFLVPPVPAERNSNGHPTIWEGGTVRVIGRRTW